MERWIERKQQQAVHKQKTLKWKPYWILFFHSFANPPYRPIRFAKNTLIDDIIIMIMNKTIAAAEAGPNDKFVNASRYRYKTTVIPSSLYDLPIKIKGSVNNCNAPIVDVNTVNIIIGRNIGIVIYCIFWRTVAHQSVLLHIIHLVSPEDQQDI